MEQEDRALKIVVPLYGGFIVTRRPSSPFEDASETVLFAGSLDECLAFVRTRFSAVVRKTWTESAGYGVRLG